MELDFFEKDDIEWKADHVDDGKENNYYSEEDNHNHLHLNHTK